MKSSNFFPKWDDKKTVFATRTYSGDANANIWTNTQDEAQFHAEIVRLILWLKNSHSGVAILMKNYAFDEHPNPALRPMFVEIGPPKPLDRPEAMRKDDV